MFTGLVESTGCIERVDPRNQGISIRIRASESLVSELVLGESVAVDGACLTVVDFGQTEFSVEATAETLDCTTMGQATIGQTVHLERALPLGGRLGGHLVSGHIDGVGTVRSRTLDGDAVIMAFNAPKSILRYMVQKGSIAIDGVSLTVNGVDASSFDVVLIPHTQGIVHLHAKSVGAPVNLESDIIGKYVERLMGFQDIDAKNKVNIDLLQRAGFIH